MIENMIEKRDTDFLKEIKRDALQARKIKDPKARILVTLIGEASMIGKNDGNRDTTDDEVLKVIQKFVKNCDENIIQRKKNNEDLEDFKFELEVLSEYLPKQLAEHDLRMKIVNYVVLNDLSSMRDMGKVMQMLQKLLPGQYEGKMASRLVKEELKNMETLQKGRR